MKRYLLVLTVSLLVALCAGTALAANLSGTSEPDTLTGRAGSDALSGLGGGDDLWCGGGSDALRGGSGDDQINGGRGKDALLGGSGEDQIHADGDGARDAVHCGPGRDTVFAYPNDRTVGCEVNGKRALRGGVLATFKVSDELFRLWTTEPQTMWDLQQLQRGESMANIPNGRILRGPGKALHNAPYSWHLDPKDVSMAGVTIEVCDAEPSYVEENVDEFVDNVGRYCAWDAELVELRNYTGGPIRQPVPAGEPPVVIIPDEGL